MIFKRGIVGQPLRGNRRHERVSFTVGFALVAGAALATSWSLLWTTPAPPGPEAKLVGPTHVEAIEARAGSVPELDESVAVYLPREGAVLGLPLEPAPAAEEPGATDGEIVAEGLETSQMWLGLPAFAEAAGTALEVEMAGDQIWASVAAGPAGRQGRDIWPLVWVPTLVAMPFLLAHRSDSSHGGGGSGTGETPPPLTEPPPDIPTAPELIGDGDTPPPDSAPPSSTPPVSGGGSASGSSSDNPDPDLPSRELDLVADGFGAATFGAAGDDLAGGMRVQPIQEPGGATPVPEPSSILLLGAGMLLLALVLRRRAR